MVNDETQVVEARSLDDGLFDDGAARRSIVGRGSGLETEVAPSRRQAKMFTYMKLCREDNCPSHVNRKGWLTVGPALQPLTMQEHMEFLQSKHATVVLKDDGSPYRIDMNDLTAHPAQRFEPLLAEGLDQLKHLPLDQMQAMGWHRMPAVVAAVPALEDTVEYYCEHGCAQTGTDARWFLEEDIVRKHVLAVHGAAAAPDAMGRRISEAMEQMGGFQGMDPVALATAIVTALEARDVEKAAAAQLVADASNEITDEDDN